MAALRRRRLARLDGHPPDGKIVLTGRVWPEAGAIARLNPDGTPEFSDAHWGTWAGTARSSGGGLSAAAT